LAPSPSPSPSPISLCGSGINRGPFDETLRTNYVASDIILFNSNYYVAIINASYYDIYIKSFVSSSPTNPPTVINVSNEGTSFKLNIKFPNGNQLNFTIFYPSDPQNLYWIPCSYTPKYSPSPSFSPIPSPKFSPIPSSIGLCGPGNNRGSFSPYIDFVASDIILFNSNYYVANKDMPYSTMYGITNSTTMIAAESGILFSTSKGTFSILWPNLDPSWSRCNMPTSQTPVNPGPDLSLLPLVLLIDIFALPRLIKLFLWLGDFCMYQPMPIRPQPLPSAPPRLLEPPVMGFPKTTVMGFPDPVIGIPVDPIGPRPPSKLPKLPPTPRTPAGGSSGAGGSAKQAADAAKKAADAAKKAADAAKKAADDAKKAADSATQTAAQAATNAASQTNPAAKQTADAAAQAAKQTADAAAQASTQAASKATQATQAATQADASAQASQEAANQATQTDLQPVQQAAAASTAMKASQEAGTQTDIAAAAAPASSLEAAAAHKAAVAAKQAAAGDPFQPPNTELKQAATTTGETQAAPPGAPSGAQKRPPEYSVNKFKPTLDPIPENDLDPDIDPEKGIVYRKVVTPAIDGTYTVCKYWINDNTRQKTTEEITYDIKGNVIKTVTTKLTRKNGASIDLPEKNNFGIVDVNPMGVKLGEGDVIIRVEEFSDHGISPITTIERFHDDRTSDVEYSGNENNTGYNSKNKYSLNSNKTFDQLETSNRIYSDGSTDAITFGNYYRDVPDAYGSMTRVLSGPDGTLIGTSNEENVFNDDSSLKTKTEYPQGRGGPSSVTDYNTFTSSAGVPNGNNLPLDKTTFDSIGTMISSKKYNLGTLQWATMGPTYKATLSDINNAITKGHLSSDITIPTIDPVSKRIVRTDIYTMDIKSKSFVPKYIRKFDFIGNVEWGVTASYRVDNIFTDLTPSVLSVFNRDIVSNPTLQRNGKIVYQINTDGTQSIIQFNFTAPPDETQGTTSITTQKGKTTTVFEYDTILKNDPSNGNYNTTNYSTKIESTYSNIDPTRLIVRKITTPGGDIETYSFSDDANNATIQYIKEAASGGVENHTYTPGQPVTETVLITNGAKNINDKIQYNSDGTVTVQIGDQNTEYKYPTLDAFENDYKSRTFGAFTSKTVYDPNTLPKFTIKISSTTKYVDSASGTTIIKNYDKNGVLTSEDSTVGGTHITYDSTSGVFTSQSNTDYKKLTGFTITQTTDQTKPSTYTPSARLNPGDLLQTFGTNGIVSQTTDTSTQIFDRTAGTAKITIKNSDGTTIKNVWMLTAPPGTIGQPLPIQKPTDPHVLVNGEIKQTLSNDGKILSEESMNNGVHTTYDGTALTVTSSTGVDIKVGGLAITIGDGIGSTFIQNQTGTIHQVINGGVLTEETTWDAKTGNKSTTTFKDGTLTTITTDPNGKMILSKTANGAHAPEFISGAPTNFWTTTTPAQNLNFQNGILSVTTTDPASGNRITNSYQNQNAGINADGTPKYGDQAQNSPSYTQTFDRNGNFISQVSGTQTIKIITGGVVAVTQGTTTNVYTNAELPPPVVTPGTKVNANPAVGAKPIVTQVTDGSGKLINQILLDNSQIQVNGNQLKITSAADANGAWTISTYNGPFQQIQVDNPGTPVIATPPTENVNGDVIITRNITGILTQTKFATDPVTGNLVKTEYVAPSGVFSGTLTTTILDSTGKPIGTPVIQRGVKIQPDGTFIIKEPLIIPPIVIGDDSRAAALLAVAKPGPSRAAALQKEAAPQPTRGESVSEFARLSGVKRQIAILNQVGGAPVAPNPLFNAKDPSKGGASKKESVLESVTGAARLSPAPGQAPEKTPKDRNPFTNPAKPGSGSPNRKPDITKPQNPNKTSAKKINSDLHNHSTDFSTKLSGACAFAGLAVGFLSFIPGAKDQPGLNYIEQGTGAFLQITQEFIDFRNADITPVSNFVRSDHYIPSAAAEFVITPDIADANGNLDLAKLKAKVNRLTVAQMSEKVQLSGYARMSEKAAIAGKAAKSISIFRSAARVLGPLGMLAAVGMFAYGEYDASRNSNPYNLDTSDPEVLKQSKQAYASVMAINFAATMAIGALNPVLSILVFILPTSKGGKPTNLQFINADISNPDAWTVGILPGNAIGVSGNQYGGGLTAFNGHIPL
jgi:hypothetical protein